MSKLRCCGDGGDVGLGCYHDHCTGPKRDLLGATVQVVRTPPGCCGVLRHGHEGVVKQIIKSKPTNILVFEDDTLVRESDVILRKRAK